MSFTVKLESARLRQALMKVLGTRFRQKHWQEFWKALKEDGAAILVEQPTGELTVHYWAYKDWVQGRTCAAHPRYRGKGKPTSNCEVCWQVYLVEQDKKALAAFGHARKEKAAA